MRAMQASIVTARQGPPTVSIHMPISPPSPIHHSLIQKGFDSVRLFSTYLFVSKGSHIERIYYPSSIRSLAGAWASMKDKGRHTQACLQSRYALEILFVSKAVTFPSIAPSCRRGRRIRFVEKTHWKYSPHMDLSPPLRKRHL